MFPQALKSCSKCNKSPNLVTLQVHPEDPTYERHGIEDVIFSEPTSDGRRCATDAHEAITTSGDVTLLYKVEFINITLKAYSH